MLELDRSTLDQVIAKALLDAAAHPRWIVAIGRAAVELDTNPYIERQTDHPGLLIASPSGTVYSANGTCGCMAFTYGQPCWHRAAARLVRLHDERQAAEQCPNCCAAQPYAERCPAAQIDADQAKRRAEYEQAVREMEELYA
jgi:hypothetical protein